ncbi:hypothetical protein F4780DRAFT_273447 [Xylariomycetidae sp. FL0641]|nr:hypothetical protein F4780DRAFT_273447 [Xylariomycetidae sp. FL0641]
MHVVKWRNPFKSPYSDEELSKMFEKEQATWQKAWNDTNTTEGELKTRLTAALKKAPTIKKVVCFGLGHPAIADKGCAKMRQHCFALSLRDLLDSLLESPHQGVVELCVQDPAYLEQEKRLLKAQGIQVLDGALGKQEGFAAVDEETFVLSIGTTVPVQPIVCDSTSPAAMLWNTFPEPQKDYHFPPIPKLVGFRHPGSGEDGQKIKDFRGVDPL